MNENNPGRFRLPIRPSTDTCPPHLPTIMNSLRSWPNILFAALASVLLAGCATPTSMPLANDADGLKPDSKTVFLMTATLENRLRSSFQPDLFVVHVEKRDAKERADRLNFTMDDKAKVERDDAKQGNRYLLRFELPPGEYVIRGFTGFSGIFPVRGTFFAPLHADVRSTVPGVYYLGHVSAVMRERKGDEFRAGPPIPLIDQAVTGFSLGTFDIVVEDRLDAELTELRARFPALRTVSIQRDILLPFDRSKAQAFWEAN